MSDLEPNLAGGAPVSLRELRRHMPAEYRERETFDHTVLRLAEEGRIIIHRHDQPSLLPEKDREELVRDDEGNFYTAIGQRV